MVVSPKDTSRKSKNDRKSLKRSEQESKIRRRTTETKREILHILLSNLKLQDRKISYTLRKPYDYIRSLNKKIPSKTEGIAIGEPDGIRTHDPLIKSQMLYRLSYGPSTQLKWTYKG